MQSNKQNVLGTKGITSSAHDMINPRFLVLRGTRHDFELNELSQFILNELFPSLLRLLLLPFSYSFSFLLQLTFPLYGTVHSRMLALLFEYIEC